MEVSVLYVFGPFTMMQEAEIPDCQIICFFLFFLIVGKLSSSVSDDCPDDSNEDWKTEREGAKLSIRDFGSDRIFTSPF